MYVTCSTWSATRGRPRSRAMSATAAERLPARAVAHEHEAVGGHAQLPPRAGRPTRLRRFPPRVAGVRGTYDASAPAFRSMI